ncbi:MULTISPECIES: V4R domain-containing protein [Paraburkholderia]|jgi:hypothetical protein|uniref:V4R domain-containing protein n=1 Tax=Paraburkholderia phenazinium TaxID=60549 RepID=A0A1N6HYD2_9BURK|nr:4-vinyl reductase [Paraburkholderia phenazinium]SIO24659.1 V4R domain-containing protein [Paraburkholderia phenazinium]
MNAIVSRLVHDLEAGEICDGDRRYLIMRPDVLMGTLKSLDDTTRERVLSSLANSAALHGGRSVQAYGKTAVGRALLETMCDASAGLGWGRWYIEESAEELKLTVHNSPFAWGYGACTHTVCAPIVGIFRAVATQFFGTPVVVEELECAAMTSQLACHFVASRKGGTLPGNPQ